MVTISRRRRQCGINGDIALRNRQKAVILATWRKITTWRISSISIAASSGGSIKRNQRHINARRAPGRNIAHSGLERASASAIAGSINGRSIKRRKKKKKKTLAQHNVWYLSSLCYSIVINARYASRLSFRAPGAPMSCCAPLTTGNIVTMMLS